MGLGFLHNREISQAWIRIWLSCLATEGTCTGLWCLKCVTEVDCWFSVCLCSMCVLNPFAAGLPKARSYLLHRSKEGPACYHKGVLYSCVWHRAPSKLYSFFSIARPLFQHFTHSPYLPSAWHCSKFSKFHLQNALKLPKHIQCFFTKQEWHSYWKKFTAGY